MFLIGLRCSGSVCLLLSTLTLLPLLRCPFVDFFGSLASRVFLHLSPFLQEGGRPLEGLVCFPMVFLSFRSTWFSRGGVSGCAFGARELASVSSVHSWTVDTGIALLQRTPATLSVPVGSPSSSLYARRGDWVGESSERFFLCSRLSLPPHLCTFDEVVRRVRFPSAAPVRVPPDLRLRRPGGYLSPLLVGWLSFAIWLLALSLRLPCSVKRSRRCERGSSCLLFSLVRLRCDRWRGTDR